MLLIDFMSQINSLELFKFSLACIALYLAPGVDTMFIVSNGINGGPKSGFISALGVAVGTTFYVLLAIFGFSLILKNNPHLHSIIKYCGGGYLIYLAISTWCSASQISIELKPKISYLTAFKRGIFSSLLNPKIIIFIMSFIPQFIPNNTIFYQEYFILFGVIFVIGTIIFDGLAGIISGYSRNIIMLWFRKTEYIDKFSAIMFLLLGLAVFIL